MNIINIPHEHAQKRENGKSTHLWRVNLRVDIRHPYLVVDVAPGVTARVAPVGVEGLGAVQSSSLVQDETSDAWGNLIDLVSIPFVIVDVLFRWHAVCFYFCPNLPPCVRIGRGYHSLAWRGIERRSARLLDQHLTAASRSTDRKKRKDRKMVRDRKIEIDR